MVQNFVLLHKMIYNFKHTGIEGLYVVQSLFYYNQYLHCFLSLISIQDRLNECSYLKLQEHNNS